VGYESKRGLYVAFLAEGSEGRFVLEVVLTHFLVVIIPTHTFDACIGKILTRIEVLRTALPEDRLVVLRFGKEGGCFMSIRSKLLLNLFPCVFLCLGCWGFRALHAGHGRK
jgi:hypothetical protein